MKKNKYFFEKFNGLILLNKENNISSNNLLKEIRLFFKSNIIGYSGTLDVLAKGLLVCFVGKALKFSKFILNSNKSYYLDIKFGIDTDSSDPNGNIISSAPLNFFGIKGYNLKNILIRFINKYKQLVPIYSSIKKKGKCVYKYSRLGVNVYIEYKNIRFNEIKLVSISKNRMSAKFNIICSKGSYIRNFVKDIGCYLGCGSYISELVRTEIGPFILSDAIKLNNLKNKNKMFKSLIPINLLPSDILSLLF